MSRGFVRHELDTILLESVFPVAMFIAGLYALFAVLHAFLLPWPSSGLMSAIAAASVFTSLAIGLAARRGKIPLSHAYHVAFAIVFLVLANSAIHMWLMQDINQSSNFALVIIAISLFFLSQRHLLTAYAITFVVWIALALNVPSSEGDIAHFAILNVQAVLIGLLSQALRVRVNRRLIKLRSEANIREKTLAEALSKAQLYAAAERENKAKTEFLANMSHELRTPLNAILGFSEIMSREMFGPLGNGKYREYTGSIIDAGQHLLSLVNDILDLSRIQLDEQNLTVQPIDFERVCGNCIAIVRDRAQRGRVTLKFTALTKLPRVETDERRLKQVIINLLTNAVKFTPPDGHVAIEVESAPDGGAVLRVRDTGIGMSEEELHNASKPFWQADSGLDRNYEGTGLGLALVRELAKVLHAEFSLESSVGAGTVATFVLPPSIGQCHATPDAA